MSQGRDILAAEGRGAAVYGEFFGQRGNRKRCSEVHCVFMSGQHNLTGDKPQITSGPPWQEGWIFHVPCFGSLGLEGPV